MRTKISFYLVILSIAALCAAPKVGEQFNYKIKLSITPDKGQPMTMELLFNQKIKSVNKDNSFVVEITQKLPQQTTQKQANIQPFSLTLRIDKNGKPTIMGKSQSASPLPAPPSMLPSLAGILPIPPNLSKGKSFSITVPENPKSPIVFKHLGEANYKGKKYPKISMTIPSTTFSSSSPQGETKVALKGEGVFFTLPGDNRILNGKLTLKVETKGYSYTPEKKKIPLDSKSTIVVEIEKL